MVKIGVIGLGKRGLIHIHNLLMRSDIKICSIADTYFDSVQEALKLFPNSIPKYFYGDKAWQKVLDSDIDGVVICVSWENSFGITKEALKRNIYTGIEPFAANHVEELWELVELSEQFNTPAMLLENVCYRYDTMAIFNMVEQGLFGELVHLRGAYEHDLRKIKTEPGESNRDYWRLKHTQNRNADLYPTHGLGPLAKLVKINCGNQFSELFSMSSKSAGIKHYLKKNNKPNLDNIQLGDIVSTQISTENGELVKLTHDTSLPRPRSLGFRIQGTKGIWINETNEVIYFEKFNDEQWRDAREYYVQYEHNYWIKFKHKAAQSIRHQMDFFVINELVLAIKEKRNTEIDVYDLAAWSALTPLSEQSLKENKPVSYPDFTRNKWKIRKQIYLNL